MPGGRWPIDLVGRRLFGIPYLFEFPQAVSWNLFYSSIEKTKVELISHWTDFTFSIRAIHVLNIRHLSMDTQFSGRWSRTFCSKARRSATAWLVRKTGIVVKLILILFYFDRSRFRNSLKTFENWISASNFRRRQANAPSVRLEYSLDDTKS